MEYRSLILFASILITSSGYGIQHCGGAMIPRPVWDDIVVERPELLRWRSALTAQFKVWDVSYNNSEACFTGESKLSRAGLKLTIHGARPYEGVRVTSLTLDIRPLALYRTEEAAFRDQAELGAYTAKLVRSALQRTVAGTFDFDFQPSVYSDGMSPNIQLTLPPSPTSVTFFHYLSEELGN